MGQGRAIEYLGVLTHGSFPNRKTKDFDAAMTPCLPKGPRKGDKQ